MSPPEISPAAVPLLPCVPWCWVQLLKETIYHAVELCTAHGCPVWWREVCAQCNPGQTEDRCEVGASMCIVLGIVGNKCCVLKGQLLQPAALKWMQLDVVGLCITCLLDASTAESRNELTINKRSRIFWKN